MQTLQTELVQFYNELPENLVWSTTNFKFWVSEHKGGVSAVEVESECTPLTLPCDSQVFLSLHCMGESFSAQVLTFWSDSCISTANAVLALLYHPALLSPPNGAETPMSQGMQRSIKLSLTCARTICECMVLADWGSPISFVSTHPSSRCVEV